MALGEQEFRQVVLRHQGMVFSIAWRMLGNRADAEEVAQDVFMTLHRVPCQPGGPEHIERWLRRVVTHRALDFLRRHADRRLFERGEGEGGQPFEHDWLEQVHASSPGADLEQYARELSQRLDGLLATLPPAMRAAVVLRYQEELAPPEIATLLAQPLGTVKSNLQRALRLLRRKAPAVLKEYARG